MSIRWISRLGSAAALAAVATACGAAAVHPASIRQGGTATFAEQGDAIPSYIFPLYSSANWVYASTAQFQPLMYRPLYWFGQSGRPVVDYGLSLANPPKFSSGDSVVTITLKHYLWSDGQPVTTRDVAFWINLLRAEKRNYGPYVPGGFPDNVVAVTYSSPSTFTLHLNGSYNPTWYLDNQLSLITPIPQHSWDRTSAAGSPGNYDQTAAGARAVYTFLNRQAATPSSFATNPLWRVVDGPWHLTQYTVQGLAAFTPNRRYSGPNPPHLARFIEEPYSSSASEFNALRSGALDYGYLPRADTNQLPYLEHHGYRFEPWVSWLTNLLEINFTNPTVGPIFHQLYIRQAMQSLINQPQYIRSIFKGYAYPTYGPVPLEPANPYVSPAERHNPYPFDPAAAARTLEAHGWHVNPGGVSDCIDPSRCGPGIHRGEGLLFNLLYVGGQQSATTIPMMEAIQSSFDRLGIKLSLSDQPVGDYFGTVFPCSAGHACKWALGYDVDGIIYSPFYYPSGEVGYATGAGGNLGGYSNPVNDANIRASHRSAAPSSLFQYQNYLARQLPVLWLPSPEYQLSLVRDALHGTTPQNPGLQLTPENWYYS